MTTLLSQALQQTQGHLSVFIASLRQEQAITSPDEVSAQDALPLLMTENETIADDGAWGDNDDPKQSGSDDSDSVHTLKSPTGVDLIPGLSLPEVRSRLTPLSFCPIANGAVLKLTAEIVSWEDPFGVVAAGSNRAAVLNSLQGHSLTMTIAKREAMPLGYSVDAAVFLGMAA